ncbi:MAG: EAL domain-containing protein [Rhizobiales bacterium]|nr:EAL domain-containing protein [Hyphomicrobiales bacterium]
MLKNDLLVLEHDVLKTLATGRPLAEAMDLLCRRVEQLVPGVVCSVLTVDDGKLHPLAGPSLPDDYSAALDGYPIGPLAGSCGTAAFLRTEVDVEDIGTDPRWEVARDYVLPLGLVSCWSSPILARDGDAIGTFAFYYRDRLSSREVERDIVDVCVPLCAIAIEQDRAHARAHRLAYRDSLTQLGNRTAFFERARDLAAHPHAHGVVAIVYIDLDGFKEINDGLGHWTGDQVLRAAGERLRTFEGDTGMVARLGGDEFALVRGDCDAGELHDLAAGILAAFEAPFLIEGHQAKVSASAGIAYHEADDLDFTATMKNADLALYRAKAEGGGRVRFFTPAMAAAALRRRELETDLRKALDRDEFLLVYQPIVSLDTRRVAGCEALVRWRQPTTGLRMPAEFLGLAEELGLIAPIGAWVLERACREAAGWPTDAYLAVNLSAIQLRDAELCDEIAEVLARTGLPPARLQIEITEAVLLADSPATAHSLAKLRAMGVTIALDDFGTGYSSLRSVRAFKPDKIKVDRSFVREMDDSDSSRTIVGAVMALARSLGIGTVAEGIESADQIEILVGECCIEGQGYYFSRPRPAEEIHALLLADAERIEAGRVEAV